MCPHLRHAATVPSPVERHPTVARSAGSQRGIEVRISRALVDIQPHAPGCSFDIPKRVGHASMPAANVHRRRVVRDKHAFVAGVTVLFQTAVHIDVALVNEDFFVIRHLADDVAKVDVSNRSLLRVLSDRVDNLRKTPLCSAFFYVCPEPVLVR